jgi:hypothetical protein
MRGWSRSQTYRAAQLGLFGSALVRFSDKLWGVKKVPWDRETKRVLKAAR